MESEVNSQSVSSEHRNSTPESENLVHQNPSARSLNSIHNDQCSTGPVNNPESAVQNSGELDKLLSEDTDLEQNLTNGIHDTGQSSATVQNMVPEIQHSSLELQHSSIEFQSSAPTVQVSTPISQRSPSSPPSMPVNQNSSLRPTSVPATSITALISDHDSNVDNIITPVQASIFSNTPPGPSSSNVSSEDENVLKYFIILRPTGPAAKVLAKVCKELYCGGQQTVKDYYINSLGLNNSQFRKAFTSHERATLEAGTSWDSFDITFLYKLLQRVCGLAPSSDKKWADPDPQDIDELEHSLYLIKGERNFLAHEAITITDLELQHKCQYIKVLLKKLLTKTSLKKNVDYSDDIDSLESKVNDILQCSTRLSLKVYQKELEDLRHGIVSKVVNESQNELFPKYLHLWATALVGLSQNLPVDQPDGNTVPRVEQVFTNMTIKDKSETELAIQDIFCYQLSDGSLPRLLIIEGIAGIGKSYICKYILNKWASQNTSGISLIGVEIIIFIQCHSVNSESLREYLSEELLQQTCSILRHEDVIPALSKCHVIFIIDGIDEAGPRARGIIREVSTKFPSSRVLVTCRPEFTEEAKHLISQNSKNFSTFYAKGFNQIQRREYLTKLLSILETNQNEREKTMEVLSHKIQELEHHFYSLLCLPLTMMMLILLWLDDASSLSLTTTVTHIHQKTIDMRIKQLAQRMQRKPAEARHINLIEHMCRQWLKTLTKVAWEALRCNIQILDAKCVEELMESAGNYNIDPMDAMSCFLKCTTWENMFSTEYVWEFFHKSFQEYLSALYLSSNPNCLENTEECKNGQKENSIKKPHASPRSHSLCSLTKTSSRSSHLSTRVSHEMDSRHKTDNCSCLSRFIFCCYRSCMAKPCNQRAIPLNASAVSSHRELIDRGKFERRVCHIKGLADDMNLEIERANGQIDGIKSVLNSRTRRISKSMEIYDGESPYELTMASDSLHRKGALNSRTSSVSRSMERYDDESPYELTMANDSLHREGFLNSRISSVSRSMEIYDGESPYELTMANDSLQRKAELQNTLQFLGAMEASKEEVDYDKMKHILERFNQTLLVWNWFTWATFLRECKEHPVVCQLIQHILNGKEINAWDMRGSGICENLDAIKYLLKKTGFIPGEVNLWFTKENPFPEVLGSVLCTLAEVSPTTITKLKCSLKNSLDLQLCLAQQKTFDLIDLSLMGEIAKAKSDDFTGLMKYLGEQDAQFKLQVIIKNTENLTKFAKCCMIVPLPKRTELQLFVYCASEEMLNPLCQILSAFSWMKSFTFTFTHTELGDKTADVQEMLIEALRQDTVQLINVELVVEAYAESCLQSYEEMAHAIAGNVPTAVVFNDWADGDDVSLVFQGVRKA